MYKKIFRINSLLKIKYNNIRFYIIILYFFLTLFTSLFLFVLSWISREFLIRGDSVIFCPCRSPNTAVFPENFQFDVLDTLANFVPLSCTLADYTELFTKHRGFSLIFNHFNTPSYSLFCYPDIYGCLSRYYTDLIYFN